MPGYKKGKSSEISFVFSHYSICSAVLFFPYYAQHSIEERMPFAILFMYALLSVLPFVVIAEFPMTTQYLDYMNIGKSHPSSLHIRQLSNGNLAILSLPQHGKRPAEFYASPKVFTTPPPRTSVFARPPVFSSPFYYIYIIDTILSCKETPDGIYVESCGMWYGVECLFHSSPNVKGRHDSQYAYGQKYCTLRRDIIPNIVENIDYLKDYIKNYSYKKTGSRIMLYCFLKS